MSQPELDRRQLFAAAAVTAALAVPAGVQAATPPPAAFAIQPLPFDAKGIPGLSEKLLVSHHENNYAGAVRRLGAIAGQFAALDVATAPVFTINGLKREELIAWNSMILHELYFASLSGAPATPSKALAQAIERDFGSEGRWRAEFSAMGKALGGGSGWVLLTWSHRDKRLVNQWAADHTMTLAGATPILALDMYEHAYHMDYGAAAGGYVDAFMKVINWRSADAVFAKASA
jgi:superoxide dismutase, Fe-Mn family